MGRLCVFRYPDCTRLIKTTLVLFSTSPRPALTVTFVLFLTSQVINAVASAVLWDKFRLTWIMFIVARIRRGSFVRLASAVPSIPLLHLLTASFLEIRVSTKL